MFVQTNRTVVFESILDFVQRSGYGLHLERPQEFLDTFDKVASFVEDAPSVFLSHQWLGDRVLKAELGLKVYYARGSISDEGEPSSFKPIVFAKVMEYRKSESTMTFNCSVEVWYPDSKRLGSGAR